MVIIETDTLEGLRREMLFWRVNPNRALVCCKCGHLDTAIGGNLAVLLGVQMLTVVCV